MTTERLACLDAYATAAAGKLTRVYVADDDDLDGALGQATWSPYYQCHCVWLHRSILTWRRSDLRRILLHEAGHIRAGHISIKAKWGQFGLPRKTDKADPRINTVFVQAMLATREQEADEMARAIWDGDWRIRAYDPIVLIQGKEIFA